jgi:hypothetical protein
VSKPIEAPAVVHGSSEKGQGQWFNETVEKVGRAVRSGTNGKGSKSRTNTNSKTYQQNYDNIFRKDK